MEKETFCSTKLKTLYLLKTMEAIRWLWCDIAGQGSLGFFAHHCTECARCGPGRCNQHGAVEEWCLCAPSRDRPAEAPCQDCRGNCSCGPWLIPEKEEWFICFWSFPPWLAASPTLEASSSPSGIVSVFRNAVDLKHLEAKLGSHQGNEGRVAESRLSLWDAVGWGCFSIWSVCHWLNKVVFVTGSSWGCFQHAEQLKFACLKLGFKVRIKLGFLLNIGIWSLSFPPA